MFRWGITGEVELARGIPVRSATGKERTFTKKVRPGLLRQAWGSAKGSPTAHPGHEGQGLDSRAYPLLTDRRSELDVCNGLSRVDVANAILVFSAHLSMPI